MSILARDWMRNDRFERKLFHLENELEPEEKHKSYTTRKESIKSAIYGFKFNSHVCDKLRNLPQYESFLFSCIISSSKIFKRFSSIKVTL
jgi:hypothetical protein